MGGVGVEYALHGNLSVKLEYDHMDFGRDRERLACIPGTGCGAGFEYDVRQTVDLVKVGINYKFGRDEPRPLK
jgi:opacity protein-like surface antigen